MLRIKLVYTCLLSSSMQVTLTGEQQPNTCLFIARNDTDSTSCLYSVEGFAIHHYTSLERWPKALHSEGSSLLFLFVVLMWECIFTSTVPDVLRGPCHVSWMMHLWTV